jgi:hypothetical protein
MNIDEIDDDLIDELEDGDFEFVDDDSDDGAIDDGANTDYEAMPFFSMYATMLPEKNNPNSIMDNDEILLYNPFEESNQYRKVKTKTLKIEMLSNRFLVKNKQLSDNLDFFDRGKIENNMKIFTINVEKIANENKMKIEKDNQENFDYNRNDKSKKNSYSSLSNMKYTPKKP